MSEDTGQLVLSHEQMLRALSDLETKIYFPKKGAKTSDGKDQPLMLARELKLKGKDRTGDIFTLKYLNTPAGKYMQGRISDEDFERDVVSSLRKFYEQRRFFGTRQSYSKHLQEYRHISGAQQIDYRIQKRLNQEERHGCGHVKELIRKGSIDVQRKKN